MIYVSRYSKCLKLNTKKVRSFKLNLEIYTYCLLTPKLTNTAGMQAALTLLLIRTKSLTKNYLPMPTRKAKASWNGDLKNGNGEMSFGSGAYTGAYSFKSRFEEGTGTNPEELIGAANAGCFSMALSADLAEAGYAPENVTTNADVTLEMVDGDPAITTITLNTEASVPDIDEDEFHDIAEGAKKNCPVSKALAGVNIVLNANLNN